MIIYSKIAFMDNQTELRCLVDRSFERNLHFPFVNRTKHFQLKNARLKIYFLFVFWTFLDTSLLGEI